MYTHVYLKGLDFSTRKRGKVNLLCMWPDCSSVVEYSHSYQQRIHHYRIIPNEDGVLSVQVSLNNSVLTSYMYIIYISMSMYIHVHVAVVYGTSKPAVTELR